MWVYNNIVSPPFGNRVIGLSSVLLYSEKSYPAVRTGADPVPPQSYPSPSIPAAGVPLAPALRRVSEGHLPQGGRPSDTRLAAGVFYQRS